MILHVRMAEYARLTVDQIDAVAEWAHQYVPPARCFAFELVADGPHHAARFHLYDIDQYRPWMDAVPSHAEVVLNVDPCPWPFVKPCDTLDGLPL